MLSVTCLIAWTMSVRSFFFLPHGHPNRPSGPIGADLLPFLWCFFAPIRWLIHPILVKGISGFRYWFRYREKKVQSSEQAKELAMKSFVKDTTDVDGQQGRSIVTIAKLDIMHQVFNDKQRSTLETVICCYSPVLDSITTGLHFDDVVNLGLVSKAIRNAVCANSRETLRIASCVNGTKSECWSCRKQICKVHNPCYHRPSD